MTIRKLVLIGGVDTLLDTEHRAALAALAATVVAVAPGEDFSEPVSDANAAIIGFGVRFDAAAFDAAASLRYLGVASTAFDAVDTAYARRRGVAVTSLPEYSTEPVAQFVVALMLEQACGLTDGRRLRAAGVLHPLAFPARQFAGSTVGVIGLGSIGRRVAQLAAGLGAEVAYWSRTRRDDSGFRYAELDALLAEADFLSLNLALTEHTAGILDAARIAALKPGAVLIAAAPLALIDLDALAHRLGRNDIRVVLNHATADTNAAFADYPNFVYPPVVFLSPQAHHTMQELVVANLREWAATA